MSKKVIAVVGPKGGIGKSTISSNLAIALANMGKRVTAVDLDLGGANLHILLGIKHFNHSLDDFILKNANTLEEILIETGIKNLQLICGGADIPDIANMPFQQKMKLINHLLKLESEMVILDLAAGSSFNVIDFILIAHQQLMITSPESTSLIKVYGFIKSCVFRLLTFHFKSEKANDVLDILANAKDTAANPHLRTVENILDEAAKINPAAAESARKVLDKFRPNIVINMVQSAEEIKAGNVIQSLLEQYLSISSSLVTTIPTDTLVRKALFKNKPMMLAYPGSEFSLAVMRLAQQCV
ncbi:MAG: AAA family ATPase [Nitrospirae bacterium]|nr:AAA family ATPase [Nitrospirota bacterium]